MSKATETKIKIKSFTFRQMSEEDKAYLFERTRLNHTPFYMSPEGEIILCSVNIPLELLDIDQPYQRQRKHKNLQKLINNWDVRKLSPITVVMHPENNDYAVLDGKGRVLAARQLNLPGLMAIVLMQAPEDQEERLEYEADYFITQGDEVEKLRDSEKHEGRVLTGDQAAKDLDEAAREFDFNLFSSKKESNNCRSAKSLGSYNDGYSLAKAHGKDGLNFVFSIIKGAGWDIEASGYARFVVKSLRKIYEEHPVQREMIHDYLCDRLRLETPKLFKSNALTKYPKRYELNACILYLQDMLFEDLGIEKTIKFKEAN